MAAEGVEGSDGLGHTAGIWAEEDAWREIECKVRIALMLFEANDDMERKREKNDLLTLWSWLIFMLEHQVVL